MPHSADILEPSRDSIADLNTHDMIGKLKLWCAVQPPKGWEEHMFGLRDRRCSLTPCPSITNTPMLPPPSLCLDDQIHDEDSAMEEMEENPDNNENEDDQPSSNENKDDQLSGSKNEDDQPSSSENKDELPSGSKKEDDLPSGSKKENDRLPSRNDDDKGSNYNKNENDDEMESSSDSHGDIFHPHQEGGPIYTRLQKKGEGRAIDAKDIDAANHSDCDTQLPNLKKLGNLSTAALDEIHAFVKDASHTKINEANLFHLWYWAMQPKPDGADRNSINNLIMKEYNTLMIGIPKDDFAARREKLKAVYEWTRVDNAKTQFSGLAEAWSNLEDIEIVGVVMYVGQDPAGCQTSGIFGGSETIRNFINENGIDVWSLMDKYTTIFKCLRNGNGADARVAGTGSIGDVGSVLELHCHTKETPRDHNCRVFRSMMKGKMLAALRDLCITCGIEVGDPQKVSWHQLLEFLQKSRLTIVNWLHGVSPLGPGFKYKKLKAGPLCQLVVPCLRRKLGLLYDGQTDDEEEQDSLDDVLEIEIKCWNKEVIDILDADPLKGEIVLVKATNGTVLQQISDDPEWQKSLKEMDHQQQGMERPHMEASNCDTIGPQDACPIAQDLHHDLSTIPSNVHTQEPGPSKPPMPSSAIWGRVWFLWIYIRIIFQAVLTCKRPAQPSSLFPDNKILRVTIQTIVILAHLISHIMCYLLAYCNQFPPSHQGFHRIPSRTNHPYYNSPYTDDYYPPTQSGEPHWVNRGNAAQYEDNFTEEYINEDYY
ncbi:hypothetical protein F5J12DRAFT_786608 [Pisolithus orientalis]|uniref:uncharacterized protein n=1 Tax=Pisolithus orientalis TaxID=936130 RepID=UPI002225679D|nr:uncharacterized protein F5J12DRAFT_786608 [Pisolithus orientalis]KAI5989804.1 hypothetical protein F5J12DRAFT_786608 [Pisolithus orientalis]